MQGKENHLPNQGWGKLHSQVGDVLGEDFWQEIAGLIPNTGPRIDIYYTQTTVVVLTELPGLQSADQIRIYVEGQTLIIEGDIPRSYPVSENRIAQSERFFGSFRRPLPLPKPVSLNGIKATYTAGLLVAELPIEEGDSQAFIPLISVPAAACPPQARLS
ncbi:Hsp20/alpha crystallin family protein [Paenibacillus elgii]|uniref:Hsp20/alpha crystallin family protein n=1 Tax=Paenibacillus elgii TaxID=189691 RepID=A0A2T6FT27_9BACL|nr:Hsp20/alpha crystallin family protein [Paenibacillus elgii]PUA35058.1 Hsp20/alpha crystallin family protein [Paenibacillus elgii]